MEWSVGLGGLSAWEWADRKPIGLHIGSHLEEVGRDGIATGGT